MMTPDEVHARVSRGIDVLDAKFPGWPALIDLDTLELASCTRCVLGQLFADRATLSRGPFSFGLEWLGIIDDGDDHIDAAVPFGFAINGHHGETFDPLDAAWRAVIRARQAGA